MTTAAMGIPAFARGDYHTAAESAIGYLYYQERRNSKKAVEVNPNVQRLVDIGPRDAQRLGLTLMSSALRDDLVEPAMRMTLDYLKPLAPDKYVAPKAQSPDPNTKTSTEI